jgi:hypothetical protein
MRTSRNGRCAAGRMRGFSIEAVLSETEAAHLVFMREEEKLARDTYITLNEMWGLRGL